MYERLVGAMKQFTVKETRVIFFENIGESYRINELVDQEGNPYFSHGNVCHAQDMVWDLKIGSSLEGRWGRQLPGAKSFQEAIAVLIDQVGKEEGDLTVSRITEPKCIGMLREAFTKENLPLYIHCFRNCPGIIEQVLKES